MDAGRGTEVVEVGTYRSLAVLYEAPDHLPKADPCISVPA